NVGADFFRHLGSHAHALRLAAKNLDRERPLVLIETHLPLRLGIVSRQAFYGNEFRNCKADSAALFQQPAKGNISHAGHRRKHERRSDLDVANPKWFDLSHKKATRDFTSCGRKTLGARSPSPATRGKARLKRLVLPH